LFVVDTTAGKDVVGNENRVPSDIAASQIGSRDEIYPFNAIDQNS